MNIPKEIIIATLQEIHTSFNITPNQIKITNYDDYMIVIWRDEYGYKEKLKIVYDEDFKRLDIATILFDKYTKNFPQEVHNIFMWLWKDYSISIKSFNDLLNLKSSIKDYYKYIYIIYIQLLLHDLYLNKDAEIKPHLIKGGYNSYYNYNAIEFVPNTYYDVLKTELLYKYSTI